jgi:hypothetical protein
MLDAVFRIYDLGKTNAVAFVDQHHLTASDDRIVDTDIKRLSGNAIQFYDAALAEPDEIANAQ